MKSLIKKEIIHQIRSPIGLITVVLFPFILNLFFIKDMFIRGDTSIKPFFDLVPWVLLLFVSTITMRIFAEEKQTGSIELLLTLPISERKIVLSKAIVLWLVILLGFLLTLSVPVTLITLGNKAYLEILVAYIGSLLLGFSFVSMGMIFSLLTSHQLVAFILSFVFLFCTTLLGSSFLSTIFPNSISQLVTYISPIYHYDNFVRGIIDIRSVIYFTLSIIFSLYICAINLERRK